MKYGCTPIGIMRHNEGIFGYCEKCACNVSSVRRDFGIGHYEYWGSREVHTDWREVCPSCESELDYPRYEDDDRSDEQFDRMDRQTELR
jgi:hypothetical protein